MGGSAGTGRYNILLLSQLFPMCPHFSFMQDDWAVGLQQSPRALKFCDASCTIHSFLCRVQKEVYLGCLDTHSAYNQHIIGSPLCSPSYQRLSSLWSAAVQQATHVVCPWMTLACFAWPTISLWGRMSWCNLRNGWKCTCTGSVTAWFLVCLGVNYVHFWELSSINRPKPILQPTVF